MAALLRTWWESQIPVPFLLFERPSRFRFSFICMKIDYISRFKPEIQEQSLVQPHHPVCRPRPRSAHPLTPHLLRSKASILSHCHISLNPHLTAPPAVYRIILAYSQRLDILLPNLYPKLQSTSFSLCCSASVFLMVDCRCFFPPHLITLLLL